MAIDEANPLPLIGFRTLSDPCKRDDGTILCDEWSDQELLARIASGSDESLAALFRRYARVIYGVGRKILRDDAEAEDLVQDVFLYIHRKSHVFDEKKGSPRSWIVQVAYTQAFMRRRRLIGRSTREYECVKSGNEGPWCADGSAEYDQSVEGLFGRNGWQKILASLSEEQRETLRLHFFEGYTFTEIAEKLGQSYSNIRHHHYRALEKLRAGMTSKSLK